MSIKVKKGHPFKGDTKGEMRRVSFRVDDETWNALRALEAQENLTSLSRGRSELLRKLILTAFFHLSD